MVSKASEDFPLPDKPVSTTSFSLGILIEISLRLWVLALVMRIDDKSENLIQKYGITIGIFPNSFGINPYF